MKNILSRANIPVLEQFAWSNVMVAFDFDGTLAPIVREPSAAKLRVSTRTRLTLLAALYPCVVISGRSRNDVAMRLAPIRFAAVVGNHGSEYGKGRSQHANLVRAWAATLRRQLAGVGGVEIEEKGASIAVHYRKARSRRDAKARIERAISLLDGALRLVEGKLVLNVLPEGAPHKGVAVQQLRGAVGADTAIFVGDDVTDEDVFSIDEPGRLLSVRVGRSRRSAASYCLASQRDVDSFLDVLIRCAHERSLDVDGRSRQE
ncbi:MAG: trehalose-phosphatase [Polyangiaceae bacterium]